MKRMQLEGKVSIITGAGSGIGQASALRFADEGATVVIADIDESGGLRTRDQILAKGGRAEYVPVDVSQSEQIQHLIDHVLKTYGRIDVLFNNAGMEVFTTISETTEADFDRMTSVNLKGVFLGMKYVLPIMKQQKYGSIINTASAAGLSAWPGLGIYSATKGGVVLLTKAAAAEYGQHNIRVNCICPGSIWTPLLKEQFFGAMEDPKAAEKELLRNYPLNRLGEVEEVASSAVFLASDQSSFITGHALSVDGGLSSFVGDLINS